MNITLIDYHTGEFVDVLKLDRVPVRREKIDYHGRNYEVVHTGDKNGNFCVFAERVEGGRVVGLYDWMGDCADD